MSTVPNPTIMKRFAPKTTAPVVVADLQNDQPAGLVRPGLREQVVEVHHDGIVKAKQVKPGQVVKAFLHGKPCGGERTVASVTRSDDGATVTIEFSSAHPTTEYKAAYRFYVAALVGATLRQITRVPALVPYEEV